LNRP
jgi:hypothetical protein